nr:hypothetical protein [uncultured Methanolobus sp.]
MVIEILEWLVSKIISKYSFPIFASIFVFIAIFVSTHSLDLALEWVKIIWMIYGIATMTAVGLITKTILEDII